MKVQIRARKPGSRVWEVTVNDLRWNFERGCFVMTYGFADGYQPFFLKECSVTPLEIVFERNGGGAIRTETAEEAESLAETLQRAADECHESFSQMRGV